MMQQQRKGKYDGSYEYSDYNQSDNNGLLCYMIPEDDLELIDVSWRVALKPDNTCFLATICSVN